MANKSIYETIRDSLIDGRLSCNYRLPHEVTPKGLNFMVGAQDGIGLFHSGKSDASKAVAKIMILLKTGRTDEIAPIVIENGARQIVDTLLAEIQKSADELDAASIVNYAKSLAFEGSNKELVKLGIAILGLFDWSDSEEMLEKIITLGLYEEFTLYSVVVAKNWANGNDVIFRIAKSVDGWGKIHAVERLEPATGEIRDWILRNGCENSVMDAYLGLECAIKGDLIGVLRSDSLSPELYDSVAIIIDALLDEGPVEGISVFEFAEEALSRYLFFSKDHAVTLRHLWHILNLRLAVEHLELSNKKDLTRQCNAVIDQAKWNEQIKACVSDSENSEFFYATNAAGRMKIDIDDAIMSAIKANPVKNGSLVSRFYKNADYARELTELYESVLPLEEMAAGMGDYLFASEHEHEHLALEAILPELGTYPNLGEPLILAALKSPVTRERNTACGVLSAWSETLGQSVAVFSPDLYEALKIVSKEEINDNTKKGMMKLLKFVS